VLIFALMPSVIPNFAVKTLALFALWIILVVMLRVAFRVIILMILAFAMFPDLVVLTNTVPMVIQILASIALWRLLALAILPGIVLVADTLPVVI